MKYDYLIVGAGLYGSTFARLMAEHGKKCLVIDKRKTFGGNCATEFKDDIMFHKYGAHIFHTNYENVWKFVNRFDEFRQFQNNVKAISYGRVYSLPFNMNTFYEIYGTQSPTIAKRVIDNEIEKCRIKSPKNLEEQALSLVGKTIYEILIKEYTEKQWGRSCKELSSNIIKRLPLRFTYDNNYFNDKYQGIPENGYSKLVENMLTHHCNIYVILNTDFNQEFCHCNEYDKLVYTGQIDKYFGYQFGKLDWRTLRFETETLDTDNYQGCPVMNYCDKSEEFTRIIEHKHFLKDKSLKTIITKEYPKQYEEDDEPYYPIQDRRNQDLYTKYKQLADKLSNVIFGGRLGTYRYLDMDDVILQAMTDVEKELSK